MLDVELLSECIAVLESYMVSDLDGVCSAYRGKEWLFVPVSSYVVAGCSIKRDPLLMHMHSLLKPLHMATETLCWSTPAPVIHDAIGWGPDLR